VKFKIFQFSRSQGFTLIELIMVIVVLGILAISAMPKFFNISTFEQRGFFDDTLNAIRYAQKLAVATNCNVQVSIATNQFELKRPSATDRSQCRSTTSSDFTQSVMRPGSGESSYQGSLSGVSLTSTTLYFSGKGQASADINIDIGTRRITVVSSTGFVYDSTP
jgi:MSHA pilin protein MshC